jgi:putative endonuclease
MSFKSKIGAIGENTIAQYLLKRGFKIIERNYRKKWGEIDIVAEKDGIIHFVEVKTGEPDGIRPEENITPFKIHQLKRIIQTYLFDKGIAPEADFQIDAAIVLLDFNAQKAKIRFIEDIQP